MIRWKFEENIRVCLRTLVFLDRPLVFLVKPALLFSVTRFVTYLSQNQILFGSKYDILLTPLLSGLSSNSSNGSWILSTGLNCYLFPFTQTAPCISDQTYSLIFSITRVVSYLSQKKSYLGRNMMFYRPPFFLVCCVTLQIVAESHQRDWIAILFLLPLGKWSSYLLPFTLGEMEQLWLTSWCGQQ